ncbi:hypothetical protein LDY98_24210, partial [Pseudomonas aeruginosa]|nr:hypothetical protein [Pseudomonas aeruginosa]
TPARWRGFAHRGMSILVARGKQRFIINLKGEVLHDDSLGNATVGR